MRSGHLVGFDSGERSCRRREMVVDKKNTCSRSCRNMRFSCLVGNGLELTHPTFHVLSFVTSTTLVLQRSTGMRPSKCTILLTEHVVLRQQILGVLSSNLAHLRKIVVHFYSCMSARLPQKREEEPTVGYSPPPGVRYALYVGTELMLKNHFL
ncbi:hypothetical protein M438DRAFT_380151 [Aureobasidium pullulans EXF-150]|uniref:Uncharacterized protein n=1 Tax=Aureobasidium pullulans EXF-150 TaxID=1043002 RepID=A0A074XWK2_AURPU|nr:uncharacterized protein M438DRAFT_380151 [Aureobasidium pullulans EXF-150]KEQ89973.1 hypothetical protein M438DRAFT_380151 [Aureobasidium pullulans EXF-150]